MTTEISYRYDVFNRNTTVQGANFLQINCYDAEGYRYEVEENGIVSRFAYHYGILLAELDKDNEVTSSQYLGNEYVGGELPIKGSNAPDRINISNTKETCYYICDEQGSIRYVLNRNGEIKNYYQYSAFGESEVTEESYYSRLRYNSQIYDELTSQYYLRVRYYQPQIGRFTQEDILYNDGLNLYAYCQNNPVMYSDPSGYAKATNGCDPKIQGENAGDKNGSNTGLKEFDIVPYGKFKDYPGDGLTGHELLQNAWLEANGKIPKRGVGLSTKNPAIALYENPIHKFISGQQKSLGLNKKNLAGTSWRKNVLDNIQIMKEAGVPRDKIAELAWQTRKFAIDNGF